MSTQSDNKVEHGPSDGIDSLLNHVLNIPSTLS